MNNLSALVWIALGGATGSVLRALVGLALRTSFPWATLLINILGSCLMGVLVELLAQKGGMRFAPFLLTGILGGFTTFSAFSLDAVVIWQRSETVLAAGYVLGSVVLSIGALLLGMALTRGALA